MNSGNNYPYLLPSASRSFTPTNPQLLSGGWQWRPPPTAASWDPQNNWSPYSTDISSAQTPTVGSEALHEISHQTQIQGQWGIRTNMPIPSRREVLTPPARHCRPDIRSPGSYSQQRPHSTFGQQSPRIGFNPPNQFDSAKNFNIEQSESGQTVDNPDNMDGDESKQSDGSEDDEEVASELSLKALKHLNLKNEEDVASYVDYLMSTAYSGLDDNIKRYNSMVVKYSNQGYFTKKERRVYSFFRDLIKKTSGILKQDVTKIPKQHFKLEELLLDSSKVLDLNSNTQEAQIAPGPQGRYYSSGLPDRELLIQGKKNSKKKSRNSQLKRRLKANDGFDKVKMNLAKLNENPNLKMKLFRKVAEVHQSALLKGEKQAAKKLKRSVKSVIKFKEFDLNQNEDFLVRFVEKFVNGVLKQQATCHRK